MLLIVLSLVYPSSAWPTRRVLGSLGYSVVQQVTKVWVPSLYASIGHMLARAEAPSAPSSLPSRLRCHFMQAVLFACGYLLMVSIYPLLCHHRRIAFCACYAQNIWHAQNFPFLTQLLYYEDGREYDQLSILNPDYTLNYDKLAEQVSTYSLYISKWTPFNF